MVFLPIGQGARLKDQIYLLQKIIVVRKSFLEIRDKTWVRKQRTLIVAYDKKNRIETLQLSWVINLKQRITQSLKKLNDILFYISNISNVQVKRHCQWLTKSSLVKPFLNPENVWDPNNQIAVQIKQRHQNDTHGCFSSVFIVFFIGDKYSSKHMLKANNRNTRKRCEICSKLIIKTSMPSFWCLYW